jgi:redox-sensitive bicupin YhaK (pirin superfamily)
MRKKLPARAPDPDRRTLDRRALLLGLPPVLALGANACQAGDAPGARLEVEPASTLRSAAGAPLHAPVAVLELVRLGFPWKTFDPFLFCVHHEDAYPAGNRALGPAASLAGRDIGQDFAGRDGWRMYHGDVVPGFPRHPHRGFETITVTRRGFIDHSDSLGATARYGNGDVQWMTAGRGIVHAEMFPLLNSSAANPTELFQIWLNLPRSDKFVEPYFSMFWQSAVPVRAAVDDVGRATTITLTAGSYADLRAPEPPPSSWASRADSDLAIWTLELAPGARFRLPAAERGTARTLYFFRGQSLRVDRTELTAPIGARLRPDLAVDLVNGGAPAQLLMLQGRPIGEPVVARGPFVMNSASEIEEAFRDYNETGFGGWPWRGGAPVHAREQGRFAVHADGRIERAT